MTERVEYDFKVIGELEDSKKYKKAVIDSKKKDILFHRNRSKKGGVNFRKASKGLLPFLGSMFGHDNMVVFLLARYYETNGERGISRTEAIEYLEKENFNPHDIDLLLHEADVKYRKGFYKKK